MNDNLPIFDLHCDLLSYMAKRPDADPFNPDLGCSIPNLRRGKVRMQVMAIYNDVNPNSVELGLRQAGIFASLPKQFSDYFFLVKNAEELEKRLDDVKTGIIASIENASGFCTEDMPLEKGIKNLEKIISTCGRIFYISFTHHLENRFGGGNYTKTGLKPDGEVLLEYMDGKGICLDFSHTSDALADDMLNHIDKKGLKIQVMASHSNFRSVWDHPRNLPDRLALEILRREGIIGLNFLRAFLNTTNRKALYQHYLFGKESLGAGSQLAFGADFFYTLDHPDPTRFPFYYIEHEDASKYRGILENLGKAGFTADELKGIAYVNTLNFMKKIWGKS
jgi:membrane dipeptidase